MRWGGFSHRGLYAVGGGGCSEPDSRRSGRGYRLCQPKPSPFSRYCTTCREMLAAVVMCTHFRSYPRGAQFTLRTDHSSLRWLQKFCNGDGMLAHWYMLLGQFSVTFENRPGHNMQMRTVSLDSVDNVRGLTVWYSRPIIDVDSTTVLLDQPFASSEMGDSMDADLLPELSGETWVAATLLDKPTADLKPVASNLDLIVASRQDATLITVREWVQSGATSAWFESSGAAVLAVADRELFSGHRREIVAPPGSSVRGLSTRGTRSGALGYYSSIS